jgi:hypothetical protein
MIDDDGIVARVSDADQNQHARQRNGGTLCRGYDAAAEPDPEVALGGGIICAVVQMTHRDTGRIRRSQLRRRGLHRGQPRESKHSNKRPDHLNTTLSGSSYR